MSFSIEFADESHEYQARIKVIGCGGSGGNAVNTMINLGLEGVEFIVVNTDVQALNANAAPTKLTIGQSVTRGMTGPEFLNFTHAGSPTDLFAVVKNLSDALKGAAADPAQSARDALGALDSGLETITTRQTVVGARLNWIDLNTERATQMGELRAGEEADVGGTDMALAISQLQQTMTVLEASQASFARLSSLSLFDMLH